MRHIIWHTQEKNRPLNFRICVRWNVKSKLESVIFYALLCHSFGGKIKYFYTKCKTEKATLDFCKVWNFEAFYWNFSLSTNSEIRMIHIHFGLNVSTISKSRTMNVYCDFGLSFYCIMFDQTILYELKCGKN